MASKRKPVLRLTIFFISVVLVSGSILAYLSISNISNLKELTEKRIQEEQLSLAKELGNQVEEEIFGLGSIFSDALSKIGPDQFAAVRFLDTLDLTGLVFKVDNKGDFLWPWFIETAGEYDTEALTGRFQSTFKQAERAEFIEEEFGKANRIYLACLSISSNDHDSAQCLNAIARLSVKMDHGQQAFQFYSSLITKYPDLRDPNGFPYIYYAIPQLMRISDLSCQSSILELFSFCINGMKEGMIPLNHSTPGILVRLREWSESGTEPYEGYVPFNESLQVIEKRLSFIERNRATIHKYLSGDISHYAPKTENKFQVLNSNAQNGGEILLVRAEGEYVWGVSVPIKQLWNKLPEHEYLTDSDFEYEIDLVQINNILQGADTPLTTSFEISPYLPSYYLLIAMEDTGLIDNFVRRRSWIYGISLALLLGGMILGILLILRDISREEHLARLRTDFISNVTHELKTPLTSIQLFTESMVLKRIKSEQERKEYLNIILKETESLKRLINNILDFSRKEKGKREYHFEEVNISSLVTEATDDLEYWLVEKQFSLVKEVEDNVYAKTDPAALKQAIINLLNNAIKFSVDRKEITVRLKKGPEYILIQVEDRGIGIPDDQKDLIFQPFYRVGQRHAEDISGTGLGLSVVKEIVDAHRGTISVNSRINEGSCFTIQLKTNMEILA